MQPAAAPQAAPGLQPTAQQPQTPVAPSTSLKQAVTDMRSATAELAKMKASPPGRRASARVIEAREQKIAELRAVVNQRMEEIDRLRGPGNSSLAMTQ